MLRISPDYPVCHSIKNKNSNKNFSTQNQGYSINNSENPFGILGFTGKEINIAQTRVFNSYSPETYRLIDFLCPPNLKIRDKECFYFVWEDCI
ncbi:MAG: hypothetical protein ACD_20C00053G0002 [uncultured bacterium]|nr:MAG: hypothetical protein ACD_20C00053G0002 [uncultured bacterium]HBH18162.1 hypothetical protein [Cyanobacteria bacterium UBA9579]